MSDSIIIQCVILYGSVLNYQEHRMCQREDCEDVHLGKSAGFSSHHEPLW